MNKTISDLNKMYTEGEDVDSKVWAEMRSNLLLVAGDHYAKQTNKFTDRIRDNKEISESTKIRLTRNHIQRLSNIYINAITSLAPAVGFKPANPKELQDQKAAQLHQSVWQHMRVECGIGEKTRNFVTDFVNFGECAVKVYWDWQKGEFLGYGQKPVVDENDEPVVDPMTGAPQLEEDTTTTQWSGQMVHERLYGFNIFRPKSCQDMIDAPWLGIRKMANKKDIEQLVGDDEEKLKALEDNSKATYMVFDVHKASYEMSKDQIMLREVYYKPGPQCPKGYFYVYTSSGILWEGELPFGKFPIIWKGFNQLPTSPRAMSPIKTWKPYQVEINRVASKMAEHQITLGDDKIVLSNNAKMTSAGTAPGVRAYATSGPSVPVYLPGRTGDQYLPYLQETLQEMYQTAMVSELLEEKQAAQVDPYAMLLQQARQKQKFSIYSEKIEEFLVDWCKLAMDLYREYLSEDAIIQMVGSSERVNISEFKNSKPLCYQIELEPQSDDLETRMGRQLSLNHIIQYAGTSMDKSDLGKLFRQLPYLDNEEMMGDLTMDYDNATNDILAIERGEQPVVNPYDNHPYFIQRLTKRMREPDFKFLAPQVQQMIVAAKDQHEQLEVAKQQAIQRAQAGFIPSTGYLVTTQVYAPDPANPKATKALRLPYDSIAWLSKQLEAQGQGQAELAQMGDAALADLAQKTSPPPQQPTMTGAQGAQQPMNVNTLGQRNPLMPG